MQKGNFFARPKTNRIYPVTVAALVLCFALVGFFGTPNNQLWLEQAQNDAAGEQQEQKEQPTDLQTAELAPAGDELTEEFDTTAAEGILDPSEPVFDPVETTDEVHPAEDEIPGEALEVSLFRKKLLAPAEGEWVREFGFAHDDNFDDYRFHNGRDMALDLGAIVYACESGTVKEAAEDAQWGGVVVMECKNLTIGYYGIVPSSVAVGDEIAAGEIIGTAAAPYNREFSQGSHLHLVIMKNGEYEDPADYFDK